MAPKIKHPSLPYQLLKEVGASNSTPRRGQASSKFVSRKDRRKVERAQKKSSHASLKKPVATRKPSNAALRQETAISQQARKKQPDPRSLIKVRPQQTGASLDYSSHDESDGWSEDGEDAVEDVEFGLSDTQSSNDPSSQANVPHAVQDRLAQDDAEIADLERKLGIKGRKSLPKAFKDDGLDQLLQDLDRDTEPTSETKKRKAEVDAWLAMKRRKAASTLNERQDKGAISLGGEASEPDPDDDGVDSQALGSDDSDAELDRNLLGDENGGESSDADDRDGSFDGFSEDAEDAETTHTRVRENPYVAPSAGSTGPKYVPPSRRREAGLQDESKARLARQIRGLTNRISDQNMVPFATDIEKLYRENPRQHVSSALIDQLLNLVCSDTAVADRNFLLLAAFATVVYRVAGIDFGAHLVQELVERFQAYYEEAVVPGADRVSARNAAHLLSFLSGLYNFQLVGSALPFDYIRFLLDELSELNAELLLRVTRLSGTLLRQDDPSALKDIVALIATKMASVGRDKISVRTLVMIDSINDLKNNKRSGEHGREGVNEYITQTKRVLGTMSSTKLKATEPLRMGLKDIRDSDKRGKWWLVGASWAGRTTAEQGIDGLDRGNQSDEESLLLSGDEDNLPALSELAREQRMNTDVRRSIFAAIMSATDYEDAYLRLMKLRLNKDRQKEIANVLIQCTGAEQQYNPYYTLITKRLCSDRKIRWSLQDSIWTLFKRLGEPIFGEDGDEEEEEDAVELRRLVNVAKMMGTLVAQGVMNLQLLKCLNLPYLLPKTKAFVEVMLVTVLIECYGQSVKEGELEVAKAFAAVGDNPEFARGLRWFVKKVVRKTDLAHGKSGDKTIKAGCHTAMATLTKLLATDELDD